MATMQQQQAAPATMASSGASTYRWLLAWAVVLVLGGLANRSRVGHVAIYYALVLALFFLFVTQFQWLATVLSPITGQSTATGQNQGG